MEETAASTHIPVPAAIKKKYQILDSFFLEPLFIIGVLVSIVVIIIIITHYKNKREERNALANRVDEESNKRVAFTDNNHLQTVTVLLDNIGDSIEMPVSPDLNEICPLEAPEIMVCDEEGIQSDKIMTIIPQRDFKDFPKTQEDQMNMRRKAMLQMLSLPPLA